MLQKIQEKHEANLKLAGDNEVKLQQYYDGLTAIEMQLTEDPSLGGSNVPPNKDEK